ncbi:hypothetical protein KR009_004341 [Drosophila setifemur]|nr:hypothetical protein KR009_004341 [Drosophila setifemur]
MLMREAASSFGQRFSPDIWGEVEEDGGARAEMLAINAKTCTALGSMGSICKCCQKHPNCWHISDTFRLVSVFGGNRTKKKILYISIEKKRAGFEGRMELLSVSPHQMNFYAPYDRSQRRLLTLLNPNDRQVFFKLKVKSNAWRHYHVSPNAGKIEPYGTSEVSVSLNYFDFHENKEYHHRFCIQSIYAPEGWLNGEKVVAVFRRIPRVQICSFNLPVQLEANPLSLSQSGLDSLSCLGEVALERNKQLKPLCPKCPEILGLSGKLKKRERPERSGILSTVVIIVSLLGVFLTAYLQSQQMQEILGNTIYPDY